MGYDIRRKIRTQIRLIKRLIEENKLEVKVITKVAKNASPLREIPTGSDKYRTETNYHKKPAEPHNKSQKDHAETTEYKSSYSSSYEHHSSSFHDERRISSASSQRTPTPSRKSSVEVRRSVSPEKPRITKEPSPEEQSRESSPRRTRPSPEKKTPKIFNAELKKTRPVQRTVVDDKPEWVTQRTLRKVSETVSPAKTTPVPKSPKKHVTKSSTVVRESKPSDVITSGYGVGPTDDNGSPLFGLKALRAQSKSEKTKGE